MRSNKSKCTSKFIYISHEVEKTQTLAECRMNATRLFCLSYVFCARSNSNMQMKNENVTDVWHLMHGNIAFDVVLTQKREIRDNGKEEIK